MIKIESLGQLRFREFRKLFKKVILNDFPCYSERTREFFVKKDYSSKNIRSWIAKGYRKIDVAIDANSNEIVGFIFANNTYGGVGFINWLGVKPQYRSQGIGKLLVEHYARFCKEKFAHKIELNTTANNIPFYEKLGFEIIAKRSNNYFGVEQYLMEKVLGQWSENDYEL